MYWYYYSLPVQQYIYRTVQCRKCCRFDHVEIICRYTSKPHCNKCGHDHPGIGCDITERESFCFLYSGEHFANSKECPEYGRQRVTKTMMAERNISYMEASRMVLHTSHTSTQPTQPQSTRHSTQPAQSLQHTQSYCKTVVRQPKP